MSWGQSSKKQYFLTRFWKISKIPKQKNTANENKRNDENDAFLIILGENDRTKFFFGNGLMEEKMNDGSLWGFYIPIKYTLSIHLF